MTLTHAVPALAADEVTVLHCGHLFDANTGKLLGETSVVVAGERIRELKSGKANVDGATTIDLGTATCLPGLIDSHTHLTNQTSPSAYNDQFRWNNADYAIRSVVYARRTLLAGFTTVRNLGDNDGESIALRNAIKAGVVPGPRIYTAATAIAVAHGAKELLFLTDVAGLLDETGAVVPHLTTIGVKAMLSSAAVSGGMKPKLQAALTALTSGVRAISIGEEGGTTLVAA